MTGERGESYRDTLVFFIKYIFSVNLSLYQDCAAINWR